MGSIINDGRQNITPANLSCAKNINNYILTWSGLLTKAIHFSILVSICLIPLRIYSISLAIIFSASFLHFVHTSHIPKKKNKLLIFQFHNHFYTIVEPHSPFKTYQLTFINHHFNHFKIIMIPFISLTIPKYAMMLRNV